MITIAVQLKKPLPSMANERLHWAMKAARVKQQRQQAALYLQVCAGPRIASLARLVARQPVTLRCVLTRVAPRKLDGDNLQHAFKAIRDEVAKTLGLDDGSPRWTWLYAQQSSVRWPGYQIELTVTP